MIAKVITYEAVDLTSKLVLGKLRMNGATIFDSLYFLTSEFYGIKWLVILTLLAQNTIFLGRKYANLTVHYN